MSVSVCFAAFFLDPEELKCYHPLTFFFFFFSHNIKIVCAFYTAVVSLDESVSG